MRKTQSAILDENVKNKALRILETAMREPDFGNGRFVRNLFEQARMKQASRLLSMNVDKLTKKDITKLIADDFEAPPIKRAITRKIGFGA